MSIPGLGGLPYTRQIKVLHMEVANVPLCNERWHQRSSMPRKDIGALTGHVPHQESSYDRPQSQERVEHTSHTADGPQEATAWQAVGLGSSGCTDGAVLLSRVCGGRSYRG